EPVTVATELPGELAAAMETGDDRAALDILETEARAAAAETIAEARSEAERMRAGIALRQETAALEAEALARAFALWLPAYQASRELAARRLCQGALAPPGK